MQRLLTSRWAEIPVRHIVVVSGLVLIYTLTFQLLYDAIGPAVGASALLPVLAAGWRLGVPGAVLVGLLNYPLNAVLFHNADPAQWPLTPPFLDPQGLFANALFTLIGVATGWVRNLYTRTQTQAEELQREIEKRKQTERALRASEERYTLAIRGANDGLWDWDLEEDTIFFSPRWKDMLGYDEDEVGSSPDEWFHRVHPEDRRQLEVDVSAHLDGLTHQLVNEHRILHKDGGYRWMLCRGLAVRDENGTSYRMAGSQTDITRRKEAEEQLLHDAFHDALTDLPNRDLFMDRLGQALERVRRHPTHSFAVLFLDFDEFKMINDSLGHSAGDQLLVAVARRLSVCTRATDTVARLGGDEFAILAEELHTEDQATILADRLQEEVQLPFDLDGHKVTISISIGIVIADSTYDRPGEILRDADIAMYRAKARGKAGYVVFDSGMRAHVLTRLELEHDLRKALDRDELYLQYQPIVLLPTETIVGFEALARWRHPERGEVSPGEFIPIAEETGLIVPIGEWVLREACRQMIAWRRDAPAATDLTISVNISPKQFRQPDLVERVAAILEETGLPPESLMLEITESVIMKDVEFANAHLDALDGLGVEVQMDDFGTGYSSLGYLNKFSIDTIKIDRSFVSNMEADKSSREIVQTIVTLAQELDMDVIAEGIETDAQHVQLQELGCRRGQGFYFSRPVDGETAGALLANSST